MRRSQVLPPAPARRSVALAKPHRAGRLRAELLSVARVRVYGRRRGAERARGGARWRLSSAGRGSCGFSELPVDAVALCVPQRSSLCIAHVRLAAPFQRPQASARTRARCRGNGSLRLSLARDEADERSKGAYCTEWTSLLVQAEICTEGKGVEGRREARGGARERGEARMKEEEEKPTGRPRATSTTAEERRHEARCAQSSLWT